jgi:hypothetical protein
MRYLLILCFLLSGCAIPLRMEVVQKPDPLQESRFEYEKQERWKDKLELKRLAGKRWILLLKADRMKKKELLRLPKPEKEIILQSFNDSGIILKAFEKLGCSIFDVAGFLNEYGKSDIDGFCDYLADKYPFTQWFRWALDKEIFNPAKRNYELLKRLNERR